MTRVVVTRANRRPPTAFCHLLTLMAALEITCAPATTAQGGSSVAPRESRIPVGDASLYVRDIGTGQPVIVLHGGPDFDQSYRIVRPRHFMSSTTTSGDAGDPWSHAGGSSST